MTLKLLFHNFFCFIVPVYCSTLFPLWYICQNFVLLAYDSGVKIQIHASEKEHGTMKQKRRYKTTTLVTQDHPMFELRFFFSLSLSVPSFFVVPKLFGSSKSGHKVKNCQRVENRSSVARVKFSNLVSTTRKTLMTRLSFCRTSGLTSFKGLLNRRVRYIWEPHLQITFLG